METEIRPIDLKSPTEFNAWKIFLKEVDITNFSEVEIKDLDLTVGIFNQKDELLATGSLAGNILKYVAVAPNQLGTGTYFNKIVSYLVNNLAVQKEYHAFVFTKERYVKSFQHLGFTPLAVTTLGGALEKGFPDIRDYLDSIPKVTNKFSHSSAIVMNANPFTLGHQHLVEYASHHSDHVYLFVVDTNKDLFTNEERLELVKEGTKQFNNVTVISGGDYMVSPLTFPAYFIKSSQEAIKYQTQIDALIFKNWIAKALNIDCRYLGEEPLSPTTNIYNHILKEVLEPQIHVKIIPRLTLPNGQIISASTVREMIKKGDLQLLEKLVPKTTLNFIINNLDVLQERIKKGMNICGN